MLQVDTAKFKVVKTWLSAILLGISISQHYDLLISVTLLPTRNQPQTTENLQQKQLICTHQKSFR